MALQLSDCSAADRAKYVEDVDVVASADGGWDVTTRLDGRVVATRHCTDWHRAERARRQFEFMLHARLREIATAAVLLLMLIFAGAGSALAQIADNRSNEPDASRRAGAPMDVAGLLSEPSVIGRSIEFANRVMKSGDGGEVKNGFYPELSNMVTGAGWISGGPGYRHWLFGDRLFETASSSSTTADGTHSSFAIGSRLPTSAGPGDLLARLSDRQWHDAFRAGGYTEDVTT
jgi:hypothetical protein